MVPHAALGMVAYSPPSQYEIWILYSAIGLSVVVAAIVILRSLTRLVAALWKHANAAHPCPDEDGLQGYVPRCRCGYDLRWSPKRCPECGRDVRGLDRWMVKSVMQLRSGFTDLKSIDETVAGEHPAERRERK